MTLILSFISTGAVLQVSDRLTTQKISNSQYRKFDSKFNKSLILVLEDGPCIASITGDAFIAGVHTDSFLAAAICGLNPCQVFNPENGGVDIELEVDIPNFETAIKRICEWISFLVDEDAIRKSHYEFVFCGYKRVKKRKNNIKPFYFCMKKIAGSMSFSCVRPNGKDKFWYDNPRRCFLISNPEGYLNHRDRDFLLDAIKNLPLVEVKDGLVRAVREVSSRHATVGGDVMAIYFDLSVDVCIRVMYSPLDSVFDFKSETYTPWLVGLNMFMSPSLMEQALVNSGSNGVRLEITCGSVRVVFEGESGGGRPNPSKTFLLTMGPQKRRSLR